MSPRADSKQEERDKAMLMIGSGAGIYIQQMLRSPVFANWLKDVTLGSIEFRWLLVKIGLLLTLLTAHPETHRSGAGFMHSATATILVFFSYVWPVSDTNSSPLWSWLGVVLLAAGVISRWQLEKQDLAQRHRLREEKEKKDHEPETYPPQYL